MFPRQLAIYLGASSNYYLGLGLPNCTFRSLILIGAQGCPLLKWEHPQLHSNKQSDEPKNRGDDTPALVPHSDAGGKEDVAEDELEEEGSEVKQQTELKELGIKTKHILDILQAKCIVDTNHAKQKDP